MADALVQNRVLVVGCALYEVAVVAHRYQRPRPAVQQILHRGQHVGVQVVAGLVEHQHVGFVEQDQKQLEAPPLTARQVAHSRVQLVAGKAHPLEQGRGRKLAALHLVVGLVAREHHAHHVVFYGCELVEILREGGELHRAPHLHMSQGRAQRGVQQRKQRGFARPVLAEDAYALPGPDVPRYVGEHAQAVAVDADVVELQDLFAQARHGHLLQLQGIAHGRHVGDERSRRLHVEFGLAAPSLRSPREEGELLAQLVGAFPPGQGLQAVALDAFHDVGGITPLEGVHLAIVHFPHALADLVEKPAIVGDDQQSARTRWPASLQMPCQPVDGAYVQVVGGLVEHQQVPAADEQTGQVHAALLSARERPQARLERDVAEKRGHYLAGGAVGLPGVGIGLRAGDDVAHNGLGGKRHPLLEHADAQVPGLHHLAGIRLQTPG